MADIVLIRHGQSSNNATPDCDRVPDPGLTDIGVRQADATAVWLASHPIDQLYCSPFRRSIETTRPIAAAKGLVPEMRVELCEQGGCYQGYDATGKTGAPGMNRAELEDLVPGWEIEPAIQEAGWWNRPFETLPEAKKRAARVVAWMEQLLDGTSATAVFVIHADFKRRLLECILPLPEMAGDVMGPLSNAGVTHLRWSDMRWTLNSLNSTGHLSHDLITA